MLVSDAGTATDFAGTSAITLTFVQRLWRSGAAYIDTERLRADVAAAHPELVSRFMGRLESFFRDVMISRADAPFVVLISDPDHESRIVLHLPATVAYTAEGVRHTIERSATTRCVPAALRDVVAVFPDGRLFYSVSLQPLAAPGLAFDEFDVLTLTKLADPSEETADLRAEVRVADLDGRPLPLPEFLNARLARISASKDHLLPHLLPRLQRRRPGQPLSVSWSDVDHVAVAIEDAGRLAMVDRLVRDGQPADAAARSACRAFAGLVQNVLDFTRQDASEVRDSLRPVYADRHTMMFCHPRLLVELVANSRSFATGRATIGTCPYFYLVNLLAARERHLVGALERYVARVKFGAAEPDVAVTGQFLGRQRDMLRQMSRPLFGSGRRMINELAEIRLGIFQDYTVHSRPANLRYETERAALSAIVDARGLTTQAASARALLEQHEATVKDLNHYAERLAEQQIGRILFVLAIAGIVSAIADYAQLAEGSLAAKFATGVAVVAGLILTVHLAGLVLASLRTVPSRWRGEK